MQPCRETGAVQQRRLFEASPAPAKQVAKALLVILAIVQVVCVCGTAVTVLIGCICFCWELWCTAR